MSTHPEPTTRRELIGQGSLAVAAVGAAILVGTRYGPIRTELTAAVTGLKALTGPTPDHFEPLPTDSAAAEGAAHVLNRAAFGPRPGDVARVAAMGAPAYLEEQLADRMEEDPAVAWRVDALEVQQAERDSPDLLSSLPDDQLLVETQQAALLRAVYSRHQLREVLADFWTNHFNLYALKNDGRILIPVDTERVVRPHVLGSFRDMLFASAHSPAMLAYLDNQQNRRGVPNENYARELMELHTLGVRSGYTQHDIQEVARCFTGWTVTTGFQRGEFRYEAARHDDTAKHVPFLQLTIAPHGGPKDAEAVLEALAAHPATARFLSRKLCRRFLGGAPEPVVARASSAFLRSGGDIRATLRPILLDGLPTAGNPQIFKRPLEMVVSAVRALAADTSGGREIQQHLADMGQPLYQWPMPDGFPEKPSAWSGSLLPRWNFAFALVSNAIAGTTVDMAALGIQKPASGLPPDEALVDQVLTAVMSRSPSAPSLQGVRVALRTHMRQGRLAAVPAGDLLAETTGLLLASPAFQWR